MEKKINTSTQATMSNISRAIQFKAKQVIQSKNPKHAYKLLNEYSNVLEYEVIKKLYIIVIRKGSIELAVQMAKKFNNIIGFKTLENRLLTTENAEQIFLFLTSNYSQEKSKLEKRLLELGSAEFNCKYAQHLIENNPLDIKKYEQIVLNSKEPKWICELGISLLEIGYNDNVEDYIDRIINCKDAQYVYMILKKVSEKAPNIDISKYKTKIIELGTSKLIYRMASLLNNKKNDDLENAIIKSNDIVMLYIYAKNIQNIDINIFTLQ